MTTQALDPKLLPVLKTAAPAPTRFSEPTVFKDGSASNTNNAFFYIKIALILLLIASKFWTFFEMIKTPLKSVF